MMRYTIDGNGANAKRVAAMRERAGNLRPVSQKFGEFVTREARHRAPRNKMGSSQGGLAQSLNHREPAHNVTELVTPKIYGPIQQFGGRITAGRGKLGAKLLAIPLSANARRLADSLGASVSLRTLQLVLLKTRTGNLILARPRGEKTKRGRTRRGGAKAVAFGQWEYLFLLKRSVTLKPNPPPHGFAPRLDESPVRDFLAKTLRRYLRTGTA